MLNKETKAMIINELNTGLIEAAKEKVPAGANLANTLMDILYIGKEAIYRRLRGEVPFTLAEAAVISRKLGISLDKMIGVSFSNNAVFDLNVYTIVTHSRLTMTSSQDMSMHSTVSVKTLQQKWQRHRIFCLRHYISSMIFFRNSVCLSGCIRTKISDVNTLTNWRFHTKYMMPKKTSST